MRIVAGSAVSRVTVDGWETDVVGRGTQIEGVHPDMLTLYDIYLNCRCDPNIQYEQLVDGLLN